MVTREQGVEWDPVNTAYKDGILAPAPNTFSVFKFLFVVWHREKKTDGLILGRTRKSTPSDTPSAFAGNGHERMPEGGP